MPVFGGARRQLLRYVGIFYDRNLSVDQAQITQRLERVALWQGLGAHLRCLQIVQAEEKRINTADQWVVDVEIADQFHTPTGHVVQSAAAAKRRHAPAVSVGAQSQLALALQEDLPIKTDGRHRALHEKEHILFRKSEVVMIAEKRPHSGIVLGGGHDVPRDRAPDPPAGCEDLLGKDLEQGLVRYWCRLEASFGAIMSQASSLPAGNDKGGDLPGGD